MGAAPKIGLSTASVYPEGTEAAFRYAADVGYDGIELMVWADPVSQDMAAVERLVKTYGVPVLSIHAPCLLISQRVWGTDPIPKLARSVDAADRLGAPTVVVHPPFRWQRRYAEGFVDQVHELEAGSGVAVAVENMFPMRVDALFGSSRAGERMRKRGGGPGPGLSAFAPSYDPTEVGFAHYTLDLSHTATAGVDAVALARTMGDALAHLHLADGDGAPHDEHLLPGRGTQPVAQVCAELVERGFSGQAVLEINTQSVATVAERRALVGDALAFARTHLGS